MSKSITLLGSASGKNAGDASIMSGIMESIAKAYDGPITYKIPTPRPSYLSNYPSHNVQAVSMMPWHGSVNMMGIPTLGAINSSDITFIFDAVLFDRKLFNPMFNYLSSIWALTKLMGKGKFIAGFNINLGPIDTKAGAKMLKDVIERCAFVCFRDYGSLAVMEELGIEQENYMVTADSALVVAPCLDARSEEILLELGLPKDARPLAVNISSYMDTWARPRHKPLGEEGFLNCFAEGVNQFIREVDPNLQVVFVCTQHNDIPLTKKLIERVDNRIHKVLFTNVNYNHYEVKGFLSKCTMLLAMRLHANILGTGILTPTVAVEYKPKVRNYFELLGQPEHCITFENFCPEKVTTALKSGYENRDRLKAGLTKRMPELQARADIPGKIVAELFKQTQRVTSYDIARIFKEIRDQEGGVRQSQVA